MQQNRQVRMRKLTKMDKQTAYSMNIGIAS